MQKIIKFGILGAGTIAHKFAEAFASLQGDAELAAVGSRKLETAQSFAKRHEIAKAYGSYEDLVKDPDIDVIYVATPHNFHLECIRLAASHGKHVLCEKPLTVSQAETKEVRALSKAHNVFIMEAFWTKFLPAYERFMELLESRVLGKYTYMLAEYAYTPSAERRFRKLDPSLAGGALLDVGVYCVLMANAVFGTDIADISAGGLLCEHGTDIYDNITIKYKNGCNATLISSLAGNGTIRVVVFCENGSITLHNFNGAERVTVEKSGEQPVEYFLPHETNGFEYQIRHTCRCVRGNMLESDVFPLSYSEDIIKICDTAWAQIKAVNQK